MLAFGGNAEALVIAVDADGSSALHHAARKAHNEIVQLLIGAGAPINAVNSDHSTPLHWAARKNNTGAIRMLIENGADPDMKNKWGATALDNAKFADHMGSIALLATDAATRKAAENRLILERKLRPTDEERQAKLAEVAADALARREANKARLEGISNAKSETELAAKERAQVRRPSDQRELSHGRPRQQPLERDRGAPCDQRAAPRPNSAPPPFPLTA